MPSLSCIEPARLLRGARLPIRRMGPGEYAVAGSRTIRFVNLHSDTPCDCEDAEYRGGSVGPCKHEYAARLQERDARVVNALALILGTLARYAETLTTPTTTRRKAA